MLFISKLWHYNVQISYNKNEFTVYDSIIQTFMSMLIGLMNLYVFSKKNSSNVMKNQHRKVTTTVVMCIVSFNNTVTL